MRLKWTGGPEGWRSFAGEIAVIVIGVLIALGAQQLVEQYSDRQRADRALAALGRDVNDIDFTASEIEITAPCIRAQLERIRDKVVSGDRTLLTRETQGAFGEFVVRAPSRVWPSDTWHSISNSEAQIGRAHV